MPTFVQADRRRADRTGWEIVGKQRADDVRRVLAAFRDAKGWQPGMVWNPCTAAYEWPGDANR